MWQLLSRKTQLFLIVAVTLIASSAIATVNGLLSEEAQPLYRYASLIVTIITMIVTPILNWQWQRLWDLFPFLGVNFFPDLHGTWDGKLVTTWIDPNTGKTPAPIPVRFWIRQDLFNISVRMKTGESYSFSHHCFLEAAPQKGLFRIWYNYDNKPKKQLSDRSERHEGAAWLELEVGTYSNQLTGQYFTSRKTNGDIDITKTSKNILADGVENDGSTF